MKLLLSFALLVTAATATAKAPLPQEISAAQHFADTLVRGAAPKKLKAEVVWNTKWTCDIKVTATGFNLFASSTDDPERACVQALLQLARMHLI